MSCSEWRGQIIELARGRWPDSGSLPEAEKRKRAMAHASVCPECSRLLEGQRALTAACREFARETPAAPPADLESVLLAELASQRPARVHHWYRGRWQIAAGLGVAAAGLAWLAAMQRPRQPLMVPAAPAMIQGKAQEKAQRPAPAVRVVASLQEAEAAREPEKARKSEVQPAGVQASASRPSPALEARQQPSRPEADLTPFTAIPYTAPLSPWEHASIVRMEVPVTALVAVGLTTAAPDPDASTPADVIVGEDGRIRAIRLVPADDEQTISSEDRSMKR